MRLNALSPSENPMEQLLYCFGGPDDGGNGDTSSTAASEDIGTKDVDKGPRGQDTSSDRQAYSDRFGGTSTRNFNIDRSQGFVDTDKGRVYGSPETLSAGMASGDITPSGDRATADFTAGLAAPEPSIADFDTTNVPEFDEPAGAVNLEDALGYNPFGDFAATPVTQTVRGPALGTTDYEFDALGGASRAAAPGPTALSPEQEARLTAMLAAEGVALPGATTPAQAAGRQAARDAFETGQLSRGVTSAVEDLDIFGDVDPVDLMGPVDLDEVPAGALPGSGVSPMQQITRQATGPGQTVSSAEIQNKIASAGSAGTRPSTVQGQSVLSVGLGPNKQEFTFDNTVPGDQRTYTQISGPPLSDLDVFSEPADQRARDQQERAAAAAAVAAEQPAAPGPLDNIFQEQPEDAAIYGGRSIATPPAATLTDAERMSQQAADAEMTGIPVGATAERAVIEGRDPRAPDYTLAEAQANLEAAKAEAYRDKQFGFDTGLPSSIDVYGVNVPTGIGIAERVADALFDPEAALANQIAERGIKSLDGASAEGSANYNPQGLEVVTSGGPLKEGGRTVAYDARGNVVYDSRGIGSQMGDFLTGNRPPENIQALYDRQRAIADAERDRQGDGDGGGQPIILPPEEVVVPPEEYEGRPIDSTDQYTPRGPISYAYTGLPSLAPQVLRPSFQARGQYAPLFPMGNLRRS